MVLHHPTIAEQAHERVKAGDGPPSQVCTRDFRPIDVEREWPSRVVYTFEDDSSLMTIGRGRRQKITTHLP
jgi:hypothetical protein